jgi:hypothetical protein
VPCPTDQARLAKYDERRRLEGKSRQAIREGKKFYEATEATGTNAATAITQK